MKSNSRISSTQIAKLAGVSRATVSRVINKDKKVKEETREKVLEIIEKYNYSPDIAAQILAGKKANTLGFFVYMGDDDESNVDFGFEDTHKLNMIFEIIKIAASKGYFVLIDILDQFDDKEVNQKIKDMFIQRRIDGGIFMSFNNYSPLIEELVSSGFTVGLLSQELQGRNEPNRVVVNFDETSMEKAIDYLHGLGHMKIMGLHGDLDDYSARDKQNNYIHAMNKHNLKVEPNWQLYSGFSKEKAHKAMVEFLKKGQELPTAICCANDNIALGVMVALKEYNIRVPEDMSITGSDDALFAKRLNPALTTSRVNFRLILETLTEKVIECIETPYKEQFTKKFRSEFIIRDSCRKIT